MRHDLWRFIDSISQATTGHLLIGGDFNTLLRVGDRFQWNLVNEADTKDFADCLQQNDLIPLRMVENSYTWCNNQDGAARILSLIDRCLANTAWLWYNFVRKGNF